MAINPVELRLRQETGTTTGARKGGGQFGTMAGLVGGAALGGAAAAVPGAAPAAIAMGALGGAGGGSALGGMLGEKVKPSSEGTTAIDRRIQAQSTPQVSGSEKLRDSIMALHEAPPEIKQQYAQPLVSAYFASLAKERSGGQV
jgi:hypothetical protein